MEKRELRRFETGDGRRVYRLPLEVFPGLFGNAYLICGGAAPVLVDCGSGRRSSDRDLAAGFDAVGRTFGERLALADVGTLIVTHGHIDHFGGVHRVRRETPAPIAVHVLDRRVLASWEERVAVVSRRLVRFLGKAGVRAERLPAYLEMYLSMKNLFRSLPADEIFSEGPLLGGELEAFHVPGHCPGQVCLRAGELLLTADHVLAGISPHVSPEALTLSTGIGHYLDSLDKIAGLDGLRLGLGGHQGAIPDVAARAREIRRLIEERLARVLELCREPRAIADLSREIFGPVRSYHVLLAVLETGALVENLCQRGELRIANLADLSSERDPWLYLRAE